MTAKRSSWLPPFTVLFLVSFVYVVYFLLHLLPQLRRLNYLQYSSTPLLPSIPSDPHMHPAPASEVVPLAIGFHLCFVMFLASFFQAMMTPAGGVPQGDPKWERGVFGIDEQDDREIEAIIRNPHADLASSRTRALIRRMPIVERKKAKSPDEESAPLRSGADELDDLKRKCHGCMVYKPDRVHHCQVCGQCVLRMDHHCPWIANCVGFRNYKFFLLTLVYAVAAMIFLIISLLPRFLRVFAPILDMSYFLRRDLPIAICFCLCALLVVVLTVFLCFHLYLTASAMSTIEYREKKNHGDADVKHRWAVAHIKYDRGSPYENLKHVLGEPYMWLFPIDPRPGDDGTYTHVDAGPGGKSL